MPVAGRFHGRVKVLRVGIVLAAAAGEHRGQVRAAAEPGLGRDRETRVHVHRRHMRIAHVGDQRDAREPEARVVGGAGNLATEFQRELAMHGRAVHADLFEQPPAHHRHHPAAALGAGVIGALPRRAHEAAGLARIERGRGLVLEFLERGADLVAQSLEPASRTCFPLFDEGYVHTCSRITRRHCERSEAIHRAKIRMDCFVASLLAMTVKS